VRPVDLSLVIVWMHSERIVTIYLRTRDKRDGMQVMMGVSDTDNSMIEIEAVSLNKIEVLEEVDTFQKIPNISLTFWSQYK